MVSNDPFHWSVDFYQRDKCRVWSHLIVLHLPFCRPPDQYVRFTCHFIRNLLTL
jgi:hypothetical protein